MPKGYPNPAPTTVELEPGEIQITPTATLAALEANKPKMQPVKLVKNYTPLGPVADYPVIGYDKPPIMRKNSAGMLVEVEPGGFIKGERMPSMTPGTGFANKFWAGTVVSMPVEEAKYVRKSGIGEYELADD
jgi:hypothetical protein